MERDSNIEQILAAARLYYEAKLTQKEISEQLYISIPTVSRLLNTAKERGFVKITVVDPYDNASNLALRLKEIFLLKDVRIVHTYSTDPRQIKTSLSQEAVDYLMEIISPRDILGFSMGTTTQEIARLMPDHQISGLQVVTNTGCVYQNVMEDGAFDTVSIIGRKLGGSISVLFTPLFVSSIDIKKIYLSDYNTQYAIDLIKKSNISINGVGFFHPEGTIYRRNFLDDESRKRLQKKQAVGNLCSRYYNINGQVADEDLDSRTLGLTLDMLRQKEYSIAVAGGRDKVDAILGGLRGGFINVLITDDQTAKSIIQRQEELK